MGGCHRRQEPPIPPGPPHPGSPVQRTPLAVSIMEKPSGQTRATSWHPPWLQERSQPYSPHVPGGSETRTGGPQGTDATSHPSPALWYPLPGSPRDLHPTLAASLPLPRMGTVLGDAAGRGDEEQRALPGKPGGPGFRHDRQQERVGTWAGDALLSIGARAEVGSDAQAAAAAKGAERCRERGQATVRRAGTPTRSPCPPSPYSRRVHCPLPGDNIHPGQHPLPKPEKQTWGPTRRLRDRREAETTLPRAPRTESKGPGGAPPAGGESSASGTRGEGG